MFFTKGKHCNITPFSTWAPICNILFLCELNSCPGVNFAIFCPLSVTMWWAIHDVSQMLRQSCFIKTPFDAEQKTPLTSVFRAISTHSKNKWPGSSHGYLPALCPICCDGNVTARFLMQRCETCWSSRDWCLNASSPVSAQAAVKRHSVGAETKVAQEVEWVV